MPQTQICTSQSSFAPARTSYVRSVRTRDIDEQAALLNGWNQTYNQISAGSFEGAFFEAKAGPVYLFREVTSNFLHQTGELPPDVFAIGVPIAFNGNATFCGSACDGQQLHVFSGASGFEFYSPSGLDITGIVINQDFLEAALAQAGFNCGLEELDTAHLRAVSDQRGSGLRSILLRAAEVLSQGELVRGRHRVGECHGSRSCECRGRCLGRRSFRRWPPHSPNSPLADCATRLCFRKRGAAGSHHHRGDL